MTVSGRSLPVRLLISATFGCLLVMKAEVSFLSQILSLLSRQITWVPGLAEIIQLMGNSE